MFSSTQEVSEKYESVISSAPFGQEVKTNGSRSPRDPNSLSWIWMNNTESITINHPSSVPQHHQEPDSPSGQLFFYYILNAVRNYSSHVHHSAHLLKNIPSCVLWEHLWFFTLRKIYIMGMHCGQINSFVCMCTASREIPKKKRGKNNRNKKRRCCIRGKVFSSKQSWWHHGYTQIVESAAQPHSSLSGLSAAN